MFDGATAANIGVDFSSIKSTRSSPIPLGKDTNRKIRKCGVHRLYAKFFLVPQASTNRNLTRNHHPQMSIYKKFHLGQVGQICCEQEIVSKRLVREKRAKIQKWNYGS